MRTDDLRVAMLSLHVHNQISLTFHFEGREVVFVGFSDSQDSADGNLQISLDRARCAGENCYNAGRYRAQGGLSGNRFGRGASGRV